MIINELEKKVTGSGTRIVFTEGWDPRVQEAAIKLVENNIVVPILLGEPEEIEACAKENGFDVSNIQQMSPKSFDKMEEMATKMVELRRGKLDMETCKKMLQHTNYFGTMLVQMGYADGLAAIVGKGVKSPSLKISGNTKTVAGSITMFIVSLIIISGALVYFGIASWFLKAFVMAIIVTIAEAVSVKGIDNLFVPLLTSGMIFLII